METTDAFKRGSMPNAPMQVTQIQPQSATAENSKMTESAQHGDALSRCRKCYAQGDTPPP